VLKRSTPPPTPHAGIQFGLHVRSSLKTLTPEPLVFGFFFCSFFLSFFSVLCFFFLSFFFFFFFFLFFWFLFVFSFVLKSNIDNCSRPRLLFGTPLPLGLVFSSFWPFQIVSPLLQTRETEPLFSVFNKTTGWHGTCFSIVILPHASRRSLFPPHFFPFPPPAFHL